MKEFEKWLLTDEGQILVGDHRAKAAWRAALEWADARIESAMVTPSVWDLPVQIRLDIKKELGE